MAEVVAVRDDGPHDGYTAEELAGAGLIAQPHPSLDGWLLIDADGLNGSDADDVDFELSMHSFTSMVQVMGHEFLPVDGHPLDDECTYREDGTDDTYCGYRSGDHIPAASREEGKE